MKAMSSAPACRLPISSALALAGRTVRSAALGHEICYEFGFEAVQRHALWENR